MRLKKAHAFLRPYLSRLRRFLHSLLRTICPSGPSAQNILFQMRPLILNSPKLKEW